MMNKKIKKFIGITITITMMTISMIGCGSTASVSSSSRSKEVNIICWSEYLPDEVVSDFEVKTGVKVNLTTFTSPEEMLAKVQSSAKGTYDMIISPEDNIKVLNSQGLLDKINKDNIENYKNINEEYMSSSNDPNNEYSIPYMGSSLIVAVNTDVIKDEIKSYKDLLNPKYKDSMVVVEDPRVIIGAGLISNGYDVNDCSDEGLKAAKDYLTELRPNIHAFNGDSPKTLLINGECSIGLIYGAECALAMDENPAIKAIYPEEGYSLAVDVMMKTSEAKNSENADLLMNYILDPEVSASISQVFPYINPNKAAQEYLSEDYLNNDLKNVPVDKVAEAKRFIDISENLSKITDVWMSFKG